MKIVIPLYILLMLIGCSSNDQKPTDERKLGDIPINYYADKSVNSLEIPPDLTSPESQKAFRISEYVKDVSENMVSFKDNSTDNSTNVKIDSNLVTVERDGQKRWIIVSKSKDSVWDLVNEFLRLQGFTISKSSREIGILETDYLENRPKVPGSSMNFIRAWLQSVGQSYTLPTVDKFRVRVESSADDKKTEIYITLSSMEEVVKNASGDTIWQNKPKDQSLENEMMLRLMMFIGDEKNTAVQKILSAEDKTKKIEVKVSEGLNGYSKLVFATNFINTWDSLNWALDQINANIEDKDLREKSIYLKEIRTSDEGIMSKLFGGEAVRMSFQLSLKSASDSLTEVFFNDISEENEKETKDYSRDLFQKIALQF